jgi:hypothetical protein
MQSPAKPVRRRRARVIVLLVFAIFLLPIAARAALTVLEGRADSWRTADWSSTGTLPAASADREARLLVMSARTGRWKGIFAVHSWIVLKREGARNWTRYDVVGWGNPVRTNGWAPDGRWFGDVPTALIDVKGAQAAALIPKVEAAIRDYQYRRAGDYRIWPGPNSNTFVATVLRAVPGLAVAMPSNAIGKDYRDGPFFGLTDSRTGIEANLWGLLGVKVGWVEGIEINLFTLVAGLDVRHPAVKLPGFGRIGPGVGTATAAPASR